MPVAVGRDAGRAAGLGGAAEGLPDMDAPQNGQSSTSSSRTDALQDGQLRNSMMDAFSKTSCREGEIHGEGARNPAEWLLQTITLPRSAVNHRTGVRGVDYSVSLRCADISDNFSNGIRKSDYATGSILFGDLHANHHRLFHSALVAGHVTWVFPADHFCN